MYQYPCKNCEDRTLGCHSRCEKYLAAKAAHKKSADLMWKMKSEENDVADFLVDSKRKSKKRYDKR